MANSYIALSRKDVTAGVERKGNLDYLSWAYAWNALCEEHPDANFYFAEPATYPDGSVMVKAVVTVGEKTHEMTLPVMNHRNQAIQNPNARDISDAQMRCLVKCIALFGLGIGLYLGDLKHVVQHTDFEKAQQFIDANDYMGLHQFIKGLSEKDQVELFNAAPSGEKTAFKNAHRATMKQAEEFLNSVVEAIGEAVTQSDGVLLAETIDELTTYERTAVWARLDGTQQEAVKQLRTESGVSA
jgi:hypothetical protein